MLLCAVHMNLEWLAFWIAVRSWQTLGTAARWYDQYHEKAVILTCIQISSLRLHQTTMYLTMACRDVNMQWWELLWLEVLSPVFSEQWSERYLCMWNLFLIASIRLLQHSQCTEVAPADGTANTDATHTSCELSVDVGRSSDCGNAAVDTSVPTTTMNDLSAGDYTTEQQANQLAAGIAYDHNS